MKKALVNASVASMILKFNMQNIEILQSLGYQVDVACNFGRENPISREEVEQLRVKLAAMHVRIIETECPRKVWEFGKMARTYLQLRGLADTGRYDLVHTQSPIGGAICRMAFRNAWEKGTKVIYQAHGFHFYKGAPKRNWLFYYPVEKLCSRYTDVLITINKEDYRRAKHSFNAKEIVYVPGIGIDEKKFADIIIDRTRKRQEIGLTEDSFVILSVGELNENKNHKIVIEALKLVSDKIDIKNIHYIIAGKGSLEGKLKKASEALGANVHLLGFRNDVAELYKLADLFILPSIREGLNVSLMEAMSSGLPCMASDIRGNRDLIHNREFLFNPLDSKELSNKLCHLLQNRDEMIRQIREYKIDTISSDSVGKKMRAIYGLIARR